MYIAGTVGGGGVLIKSGRCPHFRGMLIEGFHCTYMYTQHIQASAIKQVLQHCVSLTTKLLSIIRLPALFN